ncbi:conserved hypothetical protein [Talaromyces stipitatus ATCC 10500]|uniref:Uncharacterized protein n=1 Tax=Talaromyces stipitatus (strain ATCC 10500 / CBS 375.48 / QM 6759 / NRRL 1006) TaxID=441959 RepID=B8MUT8_TALSN|nr:uncharacterized protein TSTA_110380 [Talaromyces stipitatus ATCC 10500]EED11858.1 conserved hypothetical protein [Talaromyces stipitatus ATCC 10500]
MTRNQSIYGLVLLALGFENKYKPLEIVTYNPTVPEGGPQTPENSARNEAIPTAPGRRQNHQAETLRAPVVEFPSLDDGKRIIYQTVASLISSLKKVITQQTNIIKLARAEIHEIKTDNPQNQLINDQHNPMTPERTELRPNQYCTAKAADNNGNNKDNFTRSLPTDAANKHIKIALSITEPTKEVQVVGISTTKTGYVIRFRDAQSAETARNNTEWLEELGNETKLEKKKGIEKIMEENDLAEKGFEIDDIAWLKKKDRPLGKSASMGIWLNTPEAAELIISNGLLVRQRYIGSVELYKVELKRYHHCQKFGHLA